MKWTASLLFFLFALYLVAFPKTLRPELILRPVFSIDIEGEEGGGEFDSELSAVPFELEDTFGYVTEVGDLLHMERKLYGVAIDSDGFINSITSDPVFLYCHVFWDILRNSLGSQQSNNLFIQQFIYLYFFICDFFF